MKRLDFNSKEKIYFVADCWEQEIKSYTFQKFYDDVVFDFIDKNFNYFEVGATDFLSFYPKSKLAQNAMEVLSGDAQPKNLSKVLFAHLAFFLNRMQRDSILFSKKREECEKWNKEIKAKPTYYS